MTCPSKNKIEKQEYKDPALKTTIEIVSVLFVGIYLLVSFLTMAWHLTWIIWIIYSLMLNI